MHPLRNMLVVLGDDRDSAVPVLEKAVALAQASGARLHAVRVVYEGLADLNAAAIDGSADLKSFILESEETLTEELVDLARRKLPALETATLWNRRGWEGVLHAAEQTEADLIIKGASSHSRHGEIVRTPDDWNLLRQATVPVMLVKPMVWARDPVVLCAVDAFDADHDDLNGALLRESQELARLLGGRLEVVATYPLFERWSGEFTALRDYEALRRDVEKEIRDRVRALAAASNVSYAQLHAEEGLTDTAISNLARELAAEVVVVGTHARQGLRGVVLGNTSERLVHLLDTDVLTVHAPTPG